MFMQEVICPLISRMTTTSHHEAYWTTFNLCACAVPGCSCPRYNASFDVRSCDCGHSWATHAVRKFHPLPPCSSGPVEAVLPGPVLDLSSLVLYGAQALPVRLKILLDRLYSVLSPQQVAHILRSLGWTLADYVRGYKMQRSDGKALERWCMMSPEEETLLLKEFLRFGETRPVVEFMVAVQHPLPKTRPEGQVEDGFSLHRPSLPTLVGGARWDQDTTDPERDLLRGGNKQENASSIIPPANSFSSSLNPCKTSLSSLRPLPSFSSAFRDLAASPSSCHLVPKGRVLCGVCGKSFYDRGTLKIHYNAVHLKLKHGCTVAGCTMVFSSLRSRNRHSANPNPRLHRAAAKDVRDNSALRSHRVSLSGAPHHSTVTTSHSDPPRENTVEEEPASLSTNQQRPWESADNLPKKKPRKSSMPLKVECWTFQ
ncbi:zinc finger protein basonuclin-2 isoform X1 [Nerophis ophidion]|uniref:zinc finger protein basonuclin-2 isoform X1 n=2 Tax=Nerophis ophidion TaxID=159077 RepID=UPI002ADFD434|nr:zinc finger protein basonuclin-2 isoform X1 [Nerophis ophidion]